MKIDVTQVLTDLDGKTIPVGNELRQAMGQVRDLLVEKRYDAALEAVEMVIQSAEPLTFRKVALNSLFGTLDGDQGMDGDQKADIFKLGHKINTDDGPDIETGKEVKLLKERIGKAYGPLVVGQCYVILNGNQSGPKGDADGPQ